MSNIQLVIRGYPLSVWDCDTKKECERGLLGLVIDDSKGLMLAVGPNGLHTIGMSMPIDVIWFDAQGHALAADTNVPAGVQVSRKGDYALELRGGWIARHPSRNVVGFPGDPNVDGGPPDCSCGNNVAPKQVSAGDPTAGMHTIQLVGPGPIQRIAGTLNRSSEHGDQFQIGWHGNDSRGAGSFERGKRGGGWGPPQHDWRWGSQHLVGHFVSGDLDPVASHYITTPRGPMTQIVGARGQRSIPRSHSPRVVRPAPGAEQGASMVERRAGQFAGAPHGGFGGGGGAPHHAGPHGPHGHHRGGRGFFGFWGFPWWEYGYACDPCDPNCPTYDPTLAECQPGVEQAPYGAASPPLYGPFPSAPPLSYPH